MVGDIVKRFDKLTMQTVALVLTFLAALPVYIGLQQGSEPVAWLGISVVAVGMAMGLWVS